MELLIELWSVLVLLQKKWGKLHMHYLEVTTHLKLLVEPKDSRHLKILKTGLEHGHLKDKECIMVQNQCKNQVKIHPIQLLLTLEVLNSQFHQMYSKK